MYRGSSCVPKMRVSSFLDAVAERSVGLRRYLVRDAGGIRSENADISSDKGSENLPRRNSKGSCVKLICAGLVDP